MGKDSPSPPPPPDPFKTAQAQTAQNIEAARANAYLNRVNEISPFGASVYVPPGMESIYGRLPPYALAPAMGNQSQMAGALAGNQGGGLPWQNAAPPPSRDNAIKEFEGGVKEYFDPDKGKWKRYDASTGHGEIISEPAWWSEQVAASMQPPQGGGPGLPWQPGGQVFGTGVGSAFDPNGIEQVRWAPPWGGGMRLAPSAPSGAPSAPGGGGDQPWTHVTYLAPQEQANLDTKRGLTSELLGLGSDQVARIAQNVAKPLSLESLPPAPQIAPQAAPPAAAAIAPPMPAAAIPPPDPMATALAAPVQPSQPPAAPPSQPPAASLGAPIAAAPAPDPMLEQQRIQERQRLADERKRIEDAMYGRATARLDPEFSLGEASLTARLRAQGIPIGSEAYTSEFDRFGRTRNDAYALARENAIAGAGGEQSRLFGLGASDINLAGSEQSRLFGLGTTARQNALQEQLTMRNQPINELAAILGNAPSVGMPQFAPPPSVGMAPADIQAAIAQNYAGQMNIFNQRMAQQNANSGALGGLAGSGLLAAGMMKAAPLMMFV